MPAGTRNFRKSLESSVLKLNAKLQRRKGRKDF